MFQFVIDYIADYKVKHEERMEETVTFLENFFNGIWREDEKEQEWECDNKESGWVAEMDFVLSSIDWANSIVTNSSV